MSFASRLTSTLSNPRVFLPLAATAGSLGLAYQYSTANPIRNDTGKTFTGGDEWIDLKLKEKTKLTHNTHHYVFELKDKDHVSGLITASCIMAKYVTAKGNNVIRPYTPTSDVNQRGTIEFVIKTYENGKFSKHLAELSPSDTVSFKGPIVKWKWEPNQYKKIALIGGGTGITPLYQLLHEITSNPEDKTQVDLYYGNLTADDILIKDILDDVASKNKDQVKIHYFLDKIPSPDWEGASDKNWVGHQGYISKDFLEKTLPGPSKDLKIFVCGPPGLYKALSGTKNSPSDQGEVSGALAELGYTKEHVYKF